MEQLQERYRTLIKETSTDFIRYLHDDIDWSARMIAVVGERGVGKTTLLLQHIKLHNSLEKALFVSADDLYFSENRLFETASIFYKNGGTHFYIDEIHKYSSWSKELKMIYDHFPKLQIIFTGSSILDIYKGSADLSRRVLMYTLYGLSFREYLNIKEGLQIKAVSLDKILTHKVKLPEVEHILPLFKEYLVQGYYPFFKEPGYIQRLRQVISFALETDIPLYASMNISTSKKLKQLLYILSQSVPFKPNLTAIGKILGIHRNQVGDFIYYLERVGVISSLRTPSEGLLSLGKMEKIYLGNATLSYALSDKMPEIGNLRETFFLSQTKVRYAVSSASKADFLVGKYTFEIGGKSKSQKQIKEISSAYLVKDEIEYGYQNTIPLWMFGFLY